MLNTNGMTLDDADELIRKSEEFFLPKTSFRFLNDHTGLRPGKWHVLLGTQGSGKSTLARSVILDTAAHSRITVYSSEETLEDTQEMMGRRGKKTKDVENINFIHESSWTKYVGKKDYKEWVRRLIVLAINFNSKAIFIDNLTTSSYYGSLGVELQGEFVQELREQTRLAGIPLFLVMHTTKNVKNDQEISGEDVRGNATFTNTAEFLYAYHKVPIEKDGQETTLAFVRIRKARGKGNIDKYYTLEYDAEKCEYRSDKVTSAKVVHELFNKRLKFGRKT